MLNLLTYHVCQNTAAYELNMLEKRWLFIFQFIVVKNTLHLFMFLFVYIFSNIYILYTFFICHYLVNKVVCVITLIKRYFRGYTVVYKPRRLVNRTQISLQLPCTMTCDLISDKSPFISRTIGISGRTRVQSVTYVYLASSRGWATTQRKDRDPARCHSQPARCRVGEGGATH